MTAFRVPDRCDTSSEALTCDRMAGNPEEEEKKEKKVTLVALVDEREAATGRPHQQKKKKPSSVPTMETTQWRAGQFSAPLLKKPSPLFIFMWAICKSTQR